MTQIKQECLNLRMPLNLFGSKKMSQCDIIVI